MKVNHIPTILFIVVFSIAMFSLSYAFEKNFENRILLSCELSKIKMVGDNFKQIDTYEDYLYLCSDEICKERFEAEINNSFEKTNKILEIDCEEIRNIGGQSNE